MEISLTTEKNSEPSGRITEPDLDVEKQVAVFGSRSNFAAHPSLFGSTAANPLKQFPSRKGNLQRPSSQPFLGP